MTNWAKIVTVEKTIDRNGKCWTGQTEGKAVKKTAGWCLGGVRLWNGAKTGRMEETGALRQVNTLTDTGRCRDTYRISSVDQGQGEQYKTVIQNIQDIETQKPVS